MERRVREGSVALVAFGGNVIQQAGQFGSIEEQAVNARGMCSRLVTLIRRGYELVVTHGNGPQVGNLLMQNDIAQESVPHMPLDVLVAQTEGALGYIIQQELLNELRRNQIRKYVVTMITQVLVDRNDPAFSNPTKPVGPFYSEASIVKLRERFTHWQVTKDANRGYRRIVPSPQPRRVIQSRMVRSLVYGGHVVLALGGGGVPMAKDSEDRYVGVEAVIDKDLSSALLATDIKADIFVILTEQDRVYLNFGTQQQTPLTYMTYLEAKTYLAEGHFPPGSMGPKITAALMYLEAGGREVVITNPENLDKALDGLSGTKVVWK